MVAIEKERDKDKERERLEERITERFQAGDMTKAADELVRCYGKELYKFLYRTLRESDAADEAFSMWSRNVMVGLQDFRRDSSFRTWAYAIARNAAQRLRRDEHRRRKRIVVGADDAVENVEWKPRSATKLEQKTEAKRLVEALMDQLSDEERELLTFRKQGLSYAEIASVLAGHTVSGSKLSSETVRLRKRCERALKHLSELVVAAGVPEKLAEKITSDLA